MLDLCKLFRQHLPQLRWQVVVLEFDPALAGERRVAAPIGPNAAVPERARVVRRKRERLLEEFACTPVDLALVDQDERLGIADDGLGIASLRARIARNDPAALDEEPDRP